MKRRTFIKMLGGAAAVTGVAAAGGGILLNQPAFGAVPQASPEILHSSHYSGGIFHNTLPTPVLSDGSSFAGALVRSLFVKKERPVPPVPVPAVRTDLAGLPRERDVLVWFGHSSFLIQAGGVRFLVDPVFSPYAAPFSFSTNAFPGTTVYAADELPPIDVLLVSHDHWDHLDYPTVMSLRNRIGRIVCPLGVGAHFRSWGFPAAAVSEADWGGTVEIGGRARVHVTESRHYSGRSLIRDRTLWGGFLIEAGGRKIHYSGDGGYGPHFAELGRKFGGIDLALLDCGQYNERWRYIHMNPEEAARAASDLGARALLPAHVGKFALARHPWDEPFERITRASLGSAWQLVTPRIGEAVALGSRLPVFRAWWRDMPSGEGAAV
ncbi:MAG: MBL fold metallo-hydrolase [Desulfovibrionaceae bacterium]|nr:MBL fold metallo-hydrolase [Desulfovibrionaceae bacterium]